MSGDTCPFCKVRVKNWNGSDPKCAFPGGIFTPENWNCATMNELRNLAEVSSIHYDGDQRCAVLNDREDGGFLILSWYKSRGCTDGAWVIRESSVSALTYERARIFLAGKGITLDLSGAAPSPEQGGGK